MDRNRDAGGTESIYNESLSARRAWIEMAMWVYWLCCGRSSLSARRAWIEILAAGRKAVEKGSLSARRAWIEIFFLASCLFVRLVALRKESVDRNRIQGE